MKKLLLLLIATLMCATAYGDVTPPAGYFYFSAQAAFNMVKRHFDATAEIYGLNTTTEPTNTDTGNVWTFFVDPTPERGWRHDAFIVQYPMFLKTGTNPLSVSYSKLGVDTPPASPMEPLQVNTIESNSIKTTPPIIKHIPISPGQLINGARTYVVIISGGGNMNNNRYHFWYDCSFLYLTLRINYAIPKSNIFPLMADGDDPSIDMMWKDNTYVSQPLDLDYDNIDDIHLAATKSNIRSTLSQIANVINEDDHLFIFVTDHGGLDNVNGSASYIDLWNNEKLYDYELANMLLPFVMKYVNINVVMGQCHSGGFIDNLSRSGTVIATACMTTESSHAYTSSLYDEFLYHWIVAMNGADSYGSLVNSDTDGDGINSMEEVFNYAKQNDPFFYKENLEHPQFSATPKQLGEDLAFSNLPTAVDLIIRDNPEDKGRVPNRSTDKNWVSPDIWVRNADDGGSVYENPYYSSTHKQAYIYVRVTNRGKKPIVSDKWLHMHWALASSGFTYNTWVGKQKDSQGRCIGEHMPAIKLPKIAAGSSTIIKIPWTLPGELMTNTDPVSHHFCLFAKITDSQTDAKSIDGTRYYDVLNSKLQAQRNVTIVDAKSASKGVAVYVRNPEETQQTFSLELVPRTGADEALYQKASIGMEMAPKISAGWQQGGMRVMNMAAVPAVNARGNRVVRFASPDNRVESISLGAEEFDKVTLRFDFDKFATEDETYTFDLIQRAEDGTIVGGETFVINAPRQSAEGVGIATAEKADGTVELAAVGNAGFEAISWSDASGNEIGTGSTVSVTPTAQNSEFTVKAYTDDGEGAKASVSLEPARGIRSVETDGRDVAVVTLISAAGGDSRLVVTSVLNNTECMSVPLAEGAVKEEIDLSALPQGVYAVTYIAGDNVIGTVKFTR